MSITGPAEGPPYKVGVALTDVADRPVRRGGHSGVSSGPAKSGHGYCIDLALLDCAVAAQVNVAQAFLTSGQLPARQGNAHMQIVPYQLFQTADSWLVLAVGNDGQWQHFCQAAGRADLASDSRFMTNVLRVQYRDILVPMIETVMRLAHHPRLGNRLSGRRRAACAGPEP